MGWGAVGGALKLLTAFTGLEVANQKGSQARSPSIHTPDGLCRATFTLQHTAAGILYKLQA